MPVSLAPLVLVKTIAARQVVEVASEEAVAGGARVGMSLAEARALCLGLVHADHEPDRDAKALGALARWLVRFSPSVMVDESAQRHAVYLDLTGCERVFGGLNRLLQQITEALRRMRLGFSAAVAPTIGAAWALTFSRDGRRRVFEDADLANDLPPLPVATLRLDQDAVATLHHLGVETIGQLMKLPRGALPARFGNGILRRLDQAFGRALEPLVPLAHHQPVEAAIDFDGVVQAPEALWEAFRQLLTRVAADLARRGCGAKQIEAVFVRPDAQPMQKTIQLSAPTRDVVTMFNLLRCALDTLVPECKRRSSSFRAGPSPGRADRRSVGCGFTKRSELRSDRAGDGPALNPLRVREQFHPEGFTALRLKVTHLERVSDEQESLVEQKALSNERELARLIERLCARLGEEVVARVEVAESHLPEWQYKRQGDKGTRRQGEGTNKFSCPDSPPRPLHLLPTPAEVRVMVSPSHDRDGRPISFTYEGRVHRVDHAIGPERIAGPWWSGRNKTRDYFDASDAETGRRFWLFRVIETSRWFVHGVFE